MFSTTSMARLVITVPSKTAKMNLHNLAPIKGSRIRKRRLARGYGGKGGGTAGRGTRGQNSRKGRGVRAGFEGGQTPLYRRIPKLKGIAGGMRAGLRSSVIVNLDELERTFNNGETVTHQTINNRLINCTGRERRLPLKILARGSISKR